MENVKRINKYLVREFGLAFDKKPKFRVVWSEDLTEVRKGLFHPLQAFESIDKRPKYSFVKDRYILEVYTLAYPGIFGPSIRQKKDVVMRDDGYEPLKVFQNRKGEYLKPDSEICKMVCDRWVELVNRPQAQRLTEKKATAQDAAQMREEIAKFEELLAADDSDMMQKFRGDEAIILPGKEF